ncbi:uncharacterized protein LOC142017084 [Carettochelys insculpta]|uniref:uncharacterized protein LOC142017084 n=1 Tax=Carettochelys insculpta TaxID=44489 RepID=UPI003EB8E865
MAQQQQPGPGNSCSAPRGRRYEELLGTDLRGGPALSPAGQCPAAPEKGDSNLLCGGWSPHHPANQAWSKQEGNEQAVPGCPVITLSLRISFGFWLQQELPEFCQKEVSLFQSLVDSPQGAGKAVPSRVRPIHGRDRLKSVHLYFSDEKDSWFSSGKTDVQGQAEQVLETPVETHPFYQLLHLPASPYKNHRGNETAKAERLPA